MRYGGLRCTVLPVHHGAYIFGSRLSRRIVYLRARFHIVMPMLLSQTPRSFSFAVPEQTANPALNPSPALPFGSLGALRLGAGLARVQAASGATSESGPGSVQTTTCDPSL